MLAGFAAVGAKTLLVSGGFTFFTDRLRRASASTNGVNTLEIVDGRLTGRVIGADRRRARRRPRASAMRRRVCVDGDGIAVAIGDGANDLPMMQAADVSVAYRAKPVCARRRPLRSTTAAWTRSSTCLPERPVSVVNAVTVSFP